MCGTAQMLGSRNATIGGVVVTSRAGSGSVGGTWRDLSNRHNVEV